MATHTRHLLIPLALVSGIFFSCGNDIDEINALIDDRDIAVQTVENGTYFFTEEGHLRNKLEAKLLDRFEGENPRIEVFDGFTLTVYDSVGSIEAVLSARTGTFWEGDGRLVAREEVELVNNEGSKLNTEELYFVQDSDLVYTNKHVIITTESGTIYGKGLVSDSRFKKRQIKQVSGTLFIEDPENSTPTDEPRTTD
jgi:LPS export ABC transporter protein LptC